MEKRILFFIFLIDFFRRIVYTILRDIVFKSVALIWFGALQAVNSVGGISIRVIVGITDRQLEPSTFFPRDDSFLFFLDIIHENC